MRDFSTLPLALLLCFGRFVRDHSDRTQAFRPRPNTPTEHCGITRPTKSLTLLKRARALCANRPGSHLSTALALALKARSAARPQASRGRRAHRNGSRGHRARIYPTHPRGGSPDIKLGEGSPFATVPRRSRGSRAWCHALRRGAVNAARAHPRSRRLKRPLCDSPPTRTTPRRTRRAYLARFDRHHFERWFGGTRRTDRHHRRDPRLNRRAFSSLRSALRVDTRRLRRRRFRSRRSSCPSFLLLRR